MRLRALLLFSLTTLVAAAASPPAADPSPPANPPVKALRITVLSTMLAGDNEKGIGEWGFAALVEVDGHRLLFDTGNRPYTVRENARELGIDLSDITEVVLSHHHSDHTGGLLTLRRAYIGKNPAALSRVHVARGAFWSRGPGEYAGDDNPLIAIRPVFEAGGGVFIEHAEPVQLYPGVWFTGPIPRPRNEQPVPPGWIVRTPDGATVPDTVPDDAALVFDTVKGLVVLTGCGHAGLINTLEYARTVVRPGGSVYAITGGFHQMRITEAGLESTAKDLRAFGVRVIHGAHCTGLETVYRLRSLLDLPRESASVAAVGSRFDLDQGIHPLVIAR